MTGEEGVFLKLKINSRKRRILRYKQSIEDLLLEIEELEEVEVQVGCGHLAHI